MKKPAAALNMHPLAPALASWCWTLDLAMGAAALTLELLQAQRTACNSLMPGARGVAPVGARLNIAEIHQRVAAAGYREISEIEWEDSHYEVEARDADGHAVELRVNGDSGVIEHVGQDD